MRFVALRRDHTQASEAAMKYFVLGAMASGFLLYGMSMMYGATGSLELSAVLQSQWLRARSTTRCWCLVWSSSWLGLAFKIGAVPFHMWIPDVYQGAPTAATLMIGGAPKLAAFAILVRLLVEGLVASWPLTGSKCWPCWPSAPWLIGNLAAIAQTNLKRMLAYSTISQMGFVLLGFVAGVINGETTLAANAYSSAMFYMVSYVLTTLASFGVIMLLARQGFESEEITDLAGLNQRSPLVRGCDGHLPVLHGRYSAHGGLLCQAVGACSLWWPRVRASTWAWRFLRSSCRLIGAFYYLRVVKVMYFDEPVTATTVSASTRMCAWSCPPTACWFCCWAFSLAHSWLCAPTAIVSMLVGLIGVEHRTMSNLHPNRFVDLAGLARRQHAVSSTSASCCWGPQCVHQALVLALDAELVVLYFVVGGAIGLAFGKPWRPNCTPRLGVLRHHRHHVCDLGFPGFCLPLSDAPSTLSAVLGHWTRACLTTT